MSMVNVVPAVDLSKWMDTVDKKVYKLEQLVTSPAVMGVPKDFVFPVIHLPGGVDIDTRPPGTPANVTVETGAFMNTLYAQISWDAPAEDPNQSDPATAQYTVELALDHGNDVYEIIDTRSTNGNSYRYEGLQPNTNYAVRVSATSKIAVPGTATGWLQFTSIKDQTIPPAVTGVFVGRGATTAVVKFTPLSEEQAPDVANGFGIYLVQIDTVNTFDSGNLKEIRSSASVVSFSDILNVGNYYARVAPIDSSGNQGPWATAGPSTVGGVIDSMIVSGLDAAKITFGSMSGDRITANTLDVASLKTSTLATQTITLSGGSFRALNGSGGVGMLINSQGISVYNSSGTRVIYLDATTGNGTFVGNISSGSNINGSTITGGSIYGALFQTVQNPIGAYLKIAPTSSPGGGPSIEFYGTDGALNCELYSTGPSGNPLYVSGGISLLSGWDLTVSGGNINLRNGIWPGYTQVSWQMRWSGSDPNQVDVGGVAPSAGGQAKTNFTGQVSTTNLFVNGYQVIYGSASAQFNNLGVNGPLVINGSTAIFGDKSTSFAAMSSSSISCSGAANVGSLQIGGTNRLYGSGDAVLAGISCTNITATALAGPQTPTYNLGVMSNGVITKVSSSKRYKKLIADLKSSKPGGKFDSANVLKLRPRLFRWKMEDPIHPDPDDRVIGLIAEEVAEVDPSLAILNPDGTAENVDWTSITTYLIAELQKLRREMDTLKATQQQPPKPAVA